MPSGVLIALQHPHISEMSMRTKTYTREPKKTKAELYEMLAEAVRNTAQPPEPKRPPKPRKMPSGLPTS